MSGSIAAAGGTDAIVPRARAIIASAAIGAALNPLNSTMIAVALPALSAEFGVPASSVTVTVVTGYLVATLASQMPAGSVADRIGYARALAVGRWLFLAGSIAGGWAPILPVVVLGRLLMAVGGSLIIPTAMALVRVAVPAGRRARAFGALGALLAGAAAIGPAIGAWMLAHFGWRALFVVNVPVLAASWLIQPRADTAVSPARRAQPFDWPGSVLIAAALVLLTFATRTAVPAAYGIGAAGLIAFVILLRHERRASAPVLQLALFRERGFVAGAGVIALQNLAMYSLLIQVPFLFRPAAGPPSARLGLAIIAMTATMAVMSPIGGWLADVIGARTVVVAGGLVGALGVIGLTQLPATALPLAIGERLLLVGLGLGLSTGPAQEVALTAAPAAQTGMASATVSMLRYLGAIGGTVILGYALNEGPSATPHPAVALWMFAGAFLISACLGAMFPTTRDLGTP